MPCLSADALETDPEGVALLREVLATSAANPMKPVPESKDVRRPVPSPSHRDLSRHPGGFVPGDLAGAADVPGSERRRADDRGRACTGGTLASRPGPLAG